MQISCSPRSRPPGYGSSLTPRCASPSPLQSSDVKLTYKYASGLVSGFTKIASTEGFGSLYAGFIPILAKQVPYAIGKLHSFHPVGVPS